MKHFFTLILTIVLSVFIITACGGSSGGGD